jgi:cell division septation protein DedD
MKNTGICLVAIVLGALALGGCSREGADWKSATAADTPEAYQQFLQQHPKSANAVQAQARMAQIADDRDWQAAAAADTRDAYQQYLAAHADSKWAQEARIRIENFAQSGTAAGSAAAAGAAAAAANPAPITASGPAVAAKPLKPAMSSPTQTATPKAAKAAATHPSSIKAGTKEDRGHFVQLGAFHSKASAEVAWKKLSAKYPSELKSLKPHFIAAKSKSGSVTKLRVGVSSASDAKGLCATLKKHSQVCVPVTA